MKNVMACVDAQGNPAAVCDGAIWAAKALGASLTFLHVLDRHPEKAPQSDFSGQIGLGAQEGLLSELAELDARCSQLAQEQGRQILEGMRQRATAGGVSEVQIRQRHGEVVESVVDLEAEVTLTVMGRHDHATVAGRHLDHHVERVIRSTAKPVLLIPGQTFETPRSFALAFDGSDTARRMLGQVGQSVWLKAMACTLVFVGTLDAALQAELDAAAVQLRTQGFTVDIAVLDGSVERVLPPHLSAQGLGMLVMGAYGHSRIRQLIVGSTTTALLRTSEVPVLVLR